MRFVITEEEKLRIKGLYEQTSKDILMAKKNPYKYPEFQDLQPKVIKSPWEKRKNEEMYYDYDKTLLYNSIEKALSAFYTPLLLNKTMRSDKNENLKITKVDVDSHVNVYDDFTYDDTNFIIKLIFDNDERLYTRIEMPNVKPYRYTKFDVPSNYKVGDYIPERTTNFYTIEPSNQLLEFLKKNPFNWIEVRKTLPDNIFSIYQKKQTDFHP